MNESPAITRSRRINPTLSVEAEFRTLNEGRDVTTLFVLQRDPELVDWLISFVDYYLVQQGKLAGPKRIAPPPGGDIRQRLTRGGVILVERRPDGGAAMRLNPEQSIWLNIKVRLANRPSCRSAVAIYDDPEVGRWLLGHLADPANPEAGYPATKETLGRLADMGVLVDEAPPEDVYFPDPRADEDPVAELATASATFEQVGGGELPPAVADILGRHVPDLPPDTGMIWGQDAGTGLVFPSRLPDGVAARDLCGDAGNAASAREQQWIRQRDEAGRSLAKAHYAVLREIIPPAQQPRLRRYVRDLVDRGYFPPLDDGQVELRSSIHNQPTITSFHNALARLVSSICGESVTGSFAYLACYHAGAVLDRHIDREQCAYNLSLVLDMDGQDGEPDPWPVYLELDGRPQVAHLQIGDGLLYSGANVYHWRDALPDGQQAIIGLFFFVPEAFAGSLH
ncbi:MAG: hypothetical protein ACE5G3_12645 [Gammaproteobacteria bacterium]